MAARPGIVRLRELGILALIGLVVFLGFDEVKGSFLTYGCRKDFDHLNPQTRCAKTVVFKKEHEAFEESLTQWLLLMEHQGKIETTAVYFRDLNNGPWFGINEKQKFAPASLLKVPLLLAFFKHAETDPGLLQKRIRYAGNLEDHRNVIPVAKTVEAGKEHSIEDLIELMIIHSDNIAKQLLLEYAEREWGKDIVEKTLVELGFPPIPQDPNEDYLTVKNYASLFRFLYNGSYLGKDMSQKALDILLQTEEPGGMGLSVPRGVAIANKFGYRHVTEGIPDQFHDCGIIYHPVSPYILCVMTKTQRLEDALMIIGEISSRMYQQVSQSSVEQ